MTGKLTVFICFFINLYTISAVRAGENHLLPLPQKYVSLNTSFRWGEVRLSTPVLQREWEDFILEMKGTVSPEAARSVEVRLSASLPEVPVNQEEAYKLDVTGKRIVIEAVTVRGIYWAMQTLRQLVEKKRTGMQVRGCAIVDWPAFRIRGFMQDVGRSYVSMEELKREIAVLSGFKINVFHWHLTENQAWRLESKVFPMLNDSANMLRMPGKYYTLEEAKELVAFCKAHQVMLIPEIDMPGHSAAFVRAFRHDMQSPEGMKILKLLLDEVCETFDVPYLHIGTDEVKFTNPRFVPEMVAYIRSKGKKVISWNPGWHYKPGEVDMTQLWSYRGKAQGGIPAIDSRFHYLNHFDTFGDIIALYHSRVGNEEQGSDGIAGTIMAVWNDRLVGSEREMIAGNNFYPNMLAMAERAWKGGGTEYFDKRGTMLPTDRQSEPFLEFADFERRLLWHKEHTFAGYPFAYVRQTDVRWNITEAFPNGGDLGRSFPPEETLRTGEVLPNSYDYEGKVYQVRPAVGAGIYLRHVWGTLMPAFYKEPKENHTAYAYTYVYSPKEQTVGLWAEFQNYSRSEADLPPLPGKWDYKGSRIWINDREILPPVWTAVHRTRSYEIALGNENCVVRPPIEVNLHKGWNKVFLKLPVGKFNTPEVRLVKWMFTAVFVTLDGQKAVDGLVYSPERNLK
ncbi:family 20 glycosylhydrolase [uncultured Bacteroides sp.]|uniref:family 20 glycosylhydrolase n=1 Tax=uncultured Bacteroides sp. TaxID=162156 RepID=UPI0026749912|nr:family 20 glycosylhydrolase [uncultured Bacteroides sp.]